MQTRTGFAALQTRTGLASLPLPALLRSAAVLHACASDTLVRLTKSVLSKAIAGHGPPLIGAAVLAATRSTAFTQFVAGTSLADAQRRAQALGHYNVRCIIDHSTEELEGVEARQAIIRAKVALLHELQAGLGPQCAFVPLKLTALMSPSLLERLTIGVAAADEAVAAAPEALDADAALALAADAAKLSSAERHELANSRAIMRELCVGARGAGIGLLLDAEQSPRQPAIRLIARSLAAEFNRPPHAPLVYDTHQCYLLGAEERVRHELNLARAGGYTLAVKLVRGAYRGSEEATKLQPTKRATDLTYDACAMLLLEASTSSSAPPAQSSGGALAGTAAPAAAALLLATHNRESVRKLVEHMRARGVSPSHERVHLAQILGMADDVTLTLGLEGFNALKLVPFGAFEEVLPWLLRRLEENQDGLAAAADERPLLRRELGRRLGLVA